MRGRTCPRHPLDSNSHLFVHPSRSFALPIPSPPPLPPEAVDYTVYFVQKFMTVTADGTLNGRMQVAMADTGSAVFIGGITALMGSIPMAASK